MSQFEWGERHYHLERFPTVEHNSALQAWEAADEYLLQQVEAERCVERPLLIVNDTFGALGCALHAMHPTLISDSFLSQQALRQNLQRNDLAIEAVTLLDSLSPWPQAPGMVLMKLPKTLALLEWQLHQLRQVAREDTLIVVGAKARDVHTSTLQRFEALMGKTHTSLAWKKARLIFTHFEPKAVSPIAERVSWLLEGTPYEIHNHANVFSRSGLDIGARFFIEHLPVNRTGRMVDLGCGNGVVGLMALQGNPEAELLFTDESYMAVASSRFNVEKNRPQDLARCHFAVNHSLSGVAPDSLQTVLCNPPFHQLTTLTDQIAWQMFIDARQGLQTGGELWIIGNRHLDYHQKLKRLFGNVTLVASNRKFVIHKAVKQGGKAR